MTKLFTLKQANVEVENQKNFLAMSREMEYIE